MRRRAPGEVPSPIRLDHGDLLVMDGLAQSEYVHRTVPGLQGPRVNLTFRWVTQHAASCPLAGVVGCVLPSCVQGLADPVSRVGDLGEPNWIMFWWSILLLSIGVCVLVGHGLIERWRRQRDSGQRSTHLVACSPRGPARWVWGKALTIVAVLSSSKAASFFIGIKFLKVAYR